MNEPLHLPHVLNVIADVTASVAGSRNAGIALALTLARLKGGQRIHIPARVTPEHWLARAVGLDAARAICHHYAAAGRGTDIDMPFGDAAGSYIAQRRARARAYAEAAERGENANKAAAQIGVTRRSIYKARAKCRPTEPDLFTRPKHPTR